MKVIETGISGLYVIEPKVFGDQRGHFFESYNKKAFDAIGLKDEFVQDNQSLSNKGVLRGMHFQKPPFTQGKLVRVVRGSVLDVALDLRSSSPTFGKHFSVTLSGDNHKLFYIPEGFAHGFLTLEDNTLFLYKCTRYYNKESEETLLWNDPEVGIDWNISNPILSEKDITGKPFSAFSSVFK